MSYEDTFQRGAQQRPGKPHRIALEGRGKLTVSGVREVESFDEQEVVMVTGEGTLIVSGEGLSVSGLDVEAGDVGVQGRISGVHYEDAIEERRSLWAKLFR